VFLVCDKPYHTNIRIIQNWRRLKISGTMHCKKLFQGCYVGVFYNKTYKHTGLCTTNHTNTQSCVQLPYKHIVLGTTNLQTHSHGTTSPTNTQLCVLQYSNYTVLGQTSTPTSQFWVHQVLQPQVMGPTWTPTTSISTTHPWVQLVP